MCVCPGKEKASIKREMGRRRRRRKKKQTNNTGASTYYLEFPSFSQAAKRFSMGDNSHKVDGEVVVDDRAPSIFLSFCVCPSWQLIYE